MKFFAVVLRASLMASFAAVGAGVGGRKVTSCVRVVGSDAGYCEEYLDSKVGCDADYALVVDKYQGGTVKGILHDKGLNATNPEENGSLGLRAAIDCLYIFADNDGATVAIASSGNITWGKWAGNCGVFTAAKKYPNGTGYYSFSYTTARDNSRPISQFTNCTDPDVIDYIKINGTFFDHKKGKLIIEGI